MGLRFKRSCSDMEIQCSPSHIPQFAFELIGKGEMDEGENMDNSKTDVGCVNGGNGGALGREGVEWQSGDDGDDYESGEDDASGQQGTDGSGEEHDSDDDSSSDENSDEEDGDEELADEDEEDYSGSGSDEDEDPLLDHAMEVYDSDSFSLFRHEYEKCKGLIVDCIDDCNSDSGSDMVCKVHRREDKTHECYKVRASYWPETVDCCCNYFAVTGMLCSHALAVFKLLHIKRIPEQYLLKWRMKSMNQSLIEYTSFQKRRKILSSQDDCLNRPLKKNKRREDTRLLIWPGTAYACDETNHFGSPILRHAKQIYVSEAYELFREEHKKSEYYMLLMYHKVVDWRGIVYGFEVCRPRLIDHQKVHAEARDGTIKCRCRKFETSGILCAHALAVFNAICIVKIPQQYIVAKFLKDPNMAADRNIHSPEYEDTLKLTISMISRYGRTFLPLPSDTWRRYDEDEESIVAVKEELRELSKDSGNNQKRKASGGGAEEEEMVGKWKLYDDHLIKDFTYKKSEAKKRKLMDYTSSFPRNWFYLKWNHILPY